MVLLSDYDRTLIQKLLSCARQISNRIITFCEVRSSKSWQDKIGYYYTEPPTARLKAACMTDVIGAGTANRRNGPGARTIALPNRRLPKWPSTLLRSHVSTLPPDRETAR